MKLVLLAEDNTLLRKVNGAEKVTLCSEFCNQKCAEYVPLSWNTGTKSYWCHRDFRFPVAQMGEEWVLWESEATRRCLYSDVSFIIKAVALKNPIYFNHAVCLCWNLQFPSQSLPYTKFFCTSPTRHDFFWLRWAVAFLHQMLRAVIREKKCWKLCDPQEFPSVAGSSLKHSSSASPLHMKHLKK